MTFENIKELEMKCMRHINKRCGIVELAECVETMTQERERKEDREMCVKSSNSWTTKSYI